MGRKDFVADLERAIGNPGAYGVSKVRRGSESDFTLVDVVCDGATITVTAFLDESSSYPSAHRFMLMVDDHVSKDVTCTISDLSDQQNRGTPLFSLLREISKTLSTDADGDMEMPDSQVDESDEYEEESDSGSFMDDFDNIGRPPAEDVTTNSSLYDNTIPMDSRNHLRQDLLHVKAAGFKIGVFGPLVQGHPGHLAISCRISKLGISDEAMQAWQLLPQEYLILLIHFPKGYRHIGHIKEASALLIKSLLDFRFGVSSSYKPSRKQVIDAFTTLSLDAQNQGTDTQKTDFRDLFISGPLQDLFSEKFGTLLKCRMTGMSWDGAMAFWHDHQETSHKGELAQDIRYRQSETTSAVYPALVSSDHIKDHNAGSRVSPPLIAMQFYLRQVVRCTEFCLVCHRQMPGDLESIKPYVCERPLCLYQYMQLGFGPSIEHEIVSQPKVVDLLISLCWVAAGPSARVYPTMLARGLGLRTPRLDILRLARSCNNQGSAAYSPQVYGRTNEPVASKELPSLLPDVPTRMRVNLQAREMLFDKGITLPSVGLKPGDWILMKASKFNHFMHCRIEETAMFPVITFSEPIIVAPDTPGAVQNPSLGPSEYQDANFITYSEDFDSLDDQSICEAIRLLLDLLPSVAEMRQYVMEGGTQHTLKKWTRIPPPCLGLLRWIIASNRACIMQIGSPDDDTPEGSTESRPTKGEQVWGMKGYMQFRFAMGAPDKERRFIESVKAVSSELKLKIPTVFAWHGSPLTNWHSIIREGLNFDITAHGRAYGNGVYFSKDLNTSLTYSGGIAYRPAPSGLGHWRSSELRVTNAISLNEIVNAPGKWVCQTPHFVVSQTDWIQTRYLFVQKLATSHPGGAPITPDVQVQPRPQNPIPQDPKYTPRGLDGDLVIPAAASRSRAQVAKRTTAAYAVRNGHKKIKTGGSAQNPIDIDEDDKDSVLTDDEDREVLRMEQPTSSHALTRSGEPMTDFERGKLDFKTLEIIPPPEGSAGSMSASRRLQTDLKAILKQQNDEPIHELGWYIDPELFELKGNLYQWIFELHSFEAHLPLAKDMKSKGIKSIVLEFIFGKDYPMAPPFVRVVRPRFLPFHMGGGGHVTAGGALCMQLLTNDGWSAVSSIESVLMQVRLAISSTDPRPARLENGPLRDYGVGEAVEAYMRACQMHGWTIPQGFREMAYAGRGGSRPM